MTTKYVAFMLRWAYCWAQLLSGIVGVLTLGFVGTSWSLKSASALARYRDMHGIQAKRTWII